MQIATSRAGFYKHDREDLLVMRFSKGTSAADRKKISDMWATLNNDPEMKEAMRLADEFAKQEGRRPRILVAIALANKMARRIWAMLTKGDSYRDPALAAA